ncbi:ATP phosphoribosyltransferase regulatory subunit [Priestia megaterium]|uniref:ATP phosphoribosyltransferase regulatory subunit n=1 Tax=Priestia megaterium TaxID=1404 RepID=UPI000BFC489F|nr:ATP phosphoribosyltransferase regulatory subunit [Priestia megaterium]MCR8865815.1 ATP phosphoribosyltransferase regulatory subunit [Priestia megaterium]MDR0131763.1 ATP phosphoribosyltransferase regulatory subunit [Priestia megaterium]MDR4221196.1 ATP phosphoribosyltransferase regulatory subunit [Priestia megaterium]PGH67294.1 ATP phosphoribosyltransferase regulatory subunit [Priestia megaterium]PGO40925.1 ATP phosphoribosyltransferase regulatory subunit [Priestia megaterium]
MSKLFMFEKPLGMRDTLPALFERKKQVRNQLADEIGSWGYQYMATPTVEYYETVGSASAILDQQLFKLLDKEGHTLVLRPDVTTPFARVAASKLLNNSPLRLAYEANVFRAQQREGGRPAEFEQIGVELIGDATMSSDAEVIALMIGALKRAGLKSFKVAIGHIGFVNSLFLEIVGNEERANVLRRFLYEKNYVGYRNHVKDLNLSSIDKQRLLQLLNLRGDEKKIEEAVELVENEGGKKAAGDLKKLWNMLDAYGVTDEIKIDFNLVSHMSYYTGILFEVFAENVGFHIGNGGRYDQLLEKFASKTPATGFGIQLDRLIEALGEEVYEPSAVYGILYSQERLDEALALAAEQRKQGYRVVTQEIAGVDDVDVFTAQFEEVTFLIGKRGKGGQ